MPHIIDTYAWIEYFRGSELGSKLRSRLETQGNITPTVVLAEMKKKYVEWERQDFDQRLAFIESRTTVMPLDTSTAILSGEIRANPPSANMGMIDCILLALARITQCKVLTGDKHFRGLRECDYIG